MMAIRIERNNKAYLQSIFYSKVYAVDGFPTSLLVHSSPCSIQEGGQNRFTVKSIKEKTLYLSNEVNKVPQCDQLRSSTLIDHGLYLFLSQQKHLADIANMYSAKFDKYTRKG